MLNMNMIPKPLNHYSDIIKQNKQFKQNTFIDKHVCCHINNKLNNNLMELYMIIIYE